jgi:hypothetical protein
MPKFGGIVLANMLAAWLDSNPKVLPPGETTYECENQGTLPE